MTPTVTIVTIGALHVLVHWPHMPHIAFPDAINKLKLFSGIPEATRNELISEGNLHHLERGDFLFYQGDPIKKFYIICKGTMRLVKETPQGKEITMEVTTRGKTIAKSDILEGNHTTHRMSACAVSDVTVLEFPTEWLRKVAKIPAIALNIISSLSEYAHMVEVEAEQKQTMNAPQRVGCFLQRLCVIHGLNPRAFELPYSKGIIASRLGLEPETLSRAILKLRDYGIMIDNNRVTITDINVVEKLICDSCSMAGHCSTHHQVAACLNDKTKF